MPPRPSHHIRPALERRLRGWFTFLGVWHVCDNAACGRARACRGNFGVCGPQTFYRLPRGVQDWFLALMICRDEGLTFDQAIARIDRTPKLCEPFAQWRASLPGARERGSQVAT